jgi:hypothetical protein
VNNGKRYARLSSNFQEDNNQNNNNSNNNRKKNDDSHKNYIENMSKEDRLRKYQTFYLHYGACCLVWFIYLPVLIFITSFVSELYRLRLVLGKFRLFYGKIKKTNQSTCIFIDK